MKFPYIPAWWPLSQHVPSLPGMSLQQDSKSRENPLMIQFFTWDCLHDSLSWWQHFEAEIPNLVELGVTQVWLPPPNKPASPEGRGYDAYDLWDLGEFNQKGVVGTRWGTKEQLISACNAARSAGIDILIDAVLNHKLGADRLETFPAVQVDPKNRLKSIGPEQNIEGWTAYDYSGREGKYSALKWDHSHFTGVDWDNKTKKEGVYRISGKGRRGWSKYVDSELGNYDYLLGTDIDHRHPAVKQDQLDWATWVLKETGAVGFRLDAIKHMDRRFLLELLRTTRRKTSPSMFAVAEYWSSDIDLLKPLIKGFKGQTSFFDVPLHQNFHEASLDSVTFDLRNIFTRTITSNYPKDAVTFVDNHDTVVGQSLESWVGHSFKVQAYALILLREHGYPCAFYGDLYPNDEGYSQEVAQAVKVLLKARKNFAYGPTKDYFDHATHLGFVRHGDDLHAGCVVLVSRRGGAVYTTRMNVGKEYAGETYHNLLGQEATADITIDADGWGEFTTASGPANVWIRKDRTTQQSE